MFIGSIISYTRWMECPSFHQKFTGVYDLWRTRFTAYCWQIPNLLPCLWISARVTLQCNAFQELGWNICKRKCVGLLSTLYPRKTYEYAWTKVGCSCGGTMLDIQYSHKTSQFICDLQRERMLLKIVCCIIYCDRIILIFLTQQANSSLTYKEKGCPYKLCVA